MHRHYNGLKTTLLFGAIVYPNGRPAPGTDIAVAAQNVHWEPKGAFTGEISVPLAAVLRTRTTSEPEGFLKALVAADSDRWGTTGERPDRYDEQRHQSGRPGDAQGLTRLRREGSRRLIALAEVRQWLASQGIQSSQAGLLTEDHLGLLCEDVVDDAVQRCSEHDQRERPGDRRAPFTEEQEQRRGEHGDRGCRRGGQS